MTTIPEDIDKIATDIVKADYSGHHDPEWAMWKAIADALVAERERCAEMVRFYGVEHDYPAIDIVWLVRTGEISPLPQEDYSI